MSTIRVVDPLACTIWSIAMSDVKATKGLSEFLSRPGARDISLCCLFQQGRCRAESNCRQVHVDRTVINQLRDNHVPKCCNHCHNLQSKSGSLTFTGRAATGMPSIPFDKILLTAGLSSLPNHDFEMPWGEVCRLQLRDACKYGDSCKNVHICAKLGRGLLARAAVNVNTHVPLNVREAAATVAVPPVTVAVAPPTPVLTQPRAPLSLRANFPILDEGSLQLKDVDLEGLVFNLPTLASCSSARYSERVDLFSPSPLARGGYSSMGTSPVRA